MRRDEHDPFGEKKIPCDVRLKDYTWNFNRCCRCCCCFFCCLFCLRVKQIEATFGNHETGQEQVQPQQLLMLLLPPLPSPELARHVRIIRRLKSKSTTGAASSRASSGNCTISHVTRDTSHVIRHT